MNKLKHIDTIPEIKVKNFEAPSNRNTRININYRNRRDAFDNNEFAKMAEDLVKEIDENNIRKNFKEAEDRLRGHPDMSALYTFVDNPKIENKVKKNLINNLENLKSNNLDINEFPRVKALNDYFENKKRITKLLEQYKEHKIYVKKTDKVFKKKSDTTNIDKEIAKLENKIAFANDNLIAELRKIDKTKLKKQKRQVEKLARRLTHVFFK